MSSFCWLFKIFMKSTLVGWWWSVGGWMLVGVTAVSYRSTLLGKPGLPSLELMCSTHMRENIFTAIGVKINIFKIDLINQSVLNGIMRNFNIVFNYNIETTPWYYYYSGINSHNI